MHCFKRLIRLSLILMLTVGVSFSCCSCGIQSSATTVATTFANAFFEEHSGIVKPCDFGDFDNKDVLDEAFSCKENDVSLDTVQAYSNFLDERFSSTVITRAEWMEKLLFTLNYEIVTDKNDDYENILDIDCYDKSDLFITAIENKIIGPNSTRFDPNCAVTRQYVSTSLVNAALYPRTYKLSCSDYKKIEDKKHAATSVALGFFELDENGCFDPYGAVTQEQVDYILSELSKLSALKGKTVMTFGDSIMHGDGNNFVGIGDMLERRYMMKSFDFSNGGSTFGKVDNREQIANQISKAINSDKTADIILINGGTNDMRKSSLGKISDGFDYESYGYQDFCSGMEYCLGLLRDNYADTPVVYIRAHNMEYGIERNELHFGKSALDICDKWEIEVVDMFSNSELNTHDKDMKCTYTVHTKSCKNGDSIHPNSGGYYKFYIPPISDKAAEILSDK